MSEDFRDTLIALVKTEAVASMVSNTPDRGEETIDTQVVALACTLSALSPDHEVLEHLLAGAVAKLQRVARGQTSLIQGTTAVMQ